jgi:hypothetical protein
MGSSGHVAGGAKEGITEANPAPAAGITEANQAPGERRATGDAAVGSPAAAKGGV